MHQVITSLRHSSFCFVYILKKNFLVRNFIFHCVGWFILLFSSNYKRNSKKKKQTTKNKFFFKSIILGPMSYLTDRRELGRELPPVEDPTAEG
jgi:hypothetical protein